MSANNSVTILDANGNPIVGLPSRAVSHQETDERVRGPWTLRRWPGARTNRLTKAHWQYARGESINEDLALLGPALRARCWYEGTTNPILHGMILTHAASVIGDYGPTVKVIHKNKGFAQRAEKAFVDWARKPEATGILNLKAVLQAVIFGLFCDGDALMQEVSVKGSRRTEVRYRLNLIEGRRLGIAGGSSVDNSVLGVVRDSIGRPTGYQIQVVDRSRPYNTAGLQFDTVSAANMIHVYFALEAGQARGMPVLASVLESAADTADVDRGVIKSLQMSTKLSALLQNTLPGSAGINSAVDYSETPLEDGMMMTVPAGYTVTQIHPEQPATNFMEYRRERHLDIGSPLGMSPSIVRHDTRGDSWSSARLNRQAYQETGCRQFRDVLTPAIERMARSVIDEAMLAGITPRVIDDYEVEVVWPAFPYVDPEADANAAQTRLSSCQTTLMDELGANGQDIEAHFEQMRKEKEFFDSIGVVWPPKTAGLTTKDTKGTENTKESAMKGNENAA